MSNCEHCGDEFKKTNWRERYCRIECALWSRVDKNGPIVVAALGPCWPWTGGVDTYGYGRFKFGGKWQVSSRTALSTTAIIPSGCYACHACDNPICCNTSHMFVGTPRENTRDMIAKGRRRPVKQEIVGGALTAKPAPCIQNGSK